MSDRTDPEVELLHEVPTRMADIREFQRELEEAANETPEVEDDADEAPTRHALELPREPAYAADLDAFGFDAPPSPPPEEAFDDEAPTRHISLPPHLLSPRPTPTPTPLVPPARSEHTPVPVEAVLDTVLTRARNTDFRTWAVVGVAVCAGVAINVGFLLGLSTGDEQGTTVAAAAKPTADVAARPAKPAPVAAAPSTEQAAVRTIALPPTVEVVTPEPTEEPLAVARRAIETADAEAAAEALEQARSAGAEPEALDRVRADLMVLRGDGAAAAPELRAMTRAYPEDAEVWLALARVLSQAEMGAEAERAFRRVLELDEHTAEAHVGLAHLATRATRLRTARQHLEDAREAYGQSAPDPLLEARLDVAEGFIALELGNYAEASRKAESALSLDAESAEAHLLLGRIDIQQDRDGTEHLRAAVAGRAPPGEALGMLVPNAGRDACALGDRYLAVAPNGFDAASVRQALRDCR